MSTPAPVPGPAPAPGPAPVPAAPVPTEQEEDGGMPIWAIILLVICIILICVVGTSWATTGNPFIMAELFTLMLQ